MCSLNFSISSSYSLVVNDIIIALTAAACDVRGDDSSRENLEAGAGDLFTNNSLILLQVSPILDGIMLAEKQEICNTETEISVNKIICSV